MATNDDWLARTAEPALEPELPICDPHHHRWDFRPDGVAPRYLLDELLEDLSGGHNIVSTVFVECGTMFKASGPDEYRPIGQTEFAAGIAAMSESGRYGPTRIAAGIRHRNSFECDHAVVVGPAFPTSTGDHSALGESIEEDRRTSAAQGRNRTITLITVDDLARLVRLRPIKQVGLRKLRELFKECKLPEQSANWVESIRRSSVVKPPYRKIVETVEELQKKFKMAAVSYSALRVELSHLIPPIEYQTDDELGELCRAMTQMAPGALFAGPEKIELDQSAENVIAAIEAAIQDYPPDER